MDGLDLRDPLGEGTGGVFFLHGDDEFRKEEALSGLVAAHVEPSTRDFNLDVLRGSEVDLERLASVLATPPLMASWRVVVLRETEAVASSAPARRLLTETAEDPPPGLVLVLVATLPERSKARFYRDLKASARTAGFPRVNANDVPGWLIDRARVMYGIELDVAAARALGAAVGTNLGVLAKELEKLTAFIGERRRMTRDDVEAAGISLPEQDRWQWFDLVGRRRFREALASLPTLLNQGESGVGLVAGLGTHLLRLGVAVEEGPRGLSELLGRQRWLAPKLMPQARGWPRHELVDAILGLRRADQLLKASGLSEETIVEEWLLTRLAVEGAA